MDIKKETIKFYDGMAKKTFEEWFDNRTLFNALSQFISRLPDSPEVLDLGCGVGGESKRLVELNASVTGIDLSEDSLKLARQNVPEARFSLMDILQMDFEPGTFHGIVESGVLFHFNKYEQDNILKKIYDMLVEKGVFLSFYPEGDFEGVQEIEIAENKYKRYSRFIPVKQWISQVMEAGFQNYQVLDFSYESFKAIEFFK